MGKVPQARPASTSTSLWGHIVLCLGVVVSAYLVYRLSGGFPPATWLLLLNTSRHLHVLWMQRGPAIFFPFAILVVQFVLLVIAWVALTIVAIREALFFLTLATTSKKKYVQQFSPSAPLIQSISQTSGTPPIWRDMLNTSGTLDTPARPSLNSSQPLFATQEAQEPETHTRSRYASTVLSPSLFTPPSDNASLNIQASQASLAREKTQPLERPQEPHTILDNPFEESHIPAYTPSPSSTVASTTTSHESLFSNPFDEQDVEVMASRAASHKLEELFNPFEPAGEAIISPGPADSSAVYSTKATTPLSSAIATQQTMQSHHFEQREEHEKNVDSEFEQFYEFVDDHAPHVSSELHTRQAQAEVQKSDDLAESFLYLLMEKGQKSNEVQTMRNVSTEPRGTAYTIERRGEETKPVHTAATQSAQAMPAPVPVRMLPMYAVTHPGLRRATKPNEDSYVMFTTTRQAPYQPPLLAGLFLVADGMGGHEDGGFASKFVAEAIRADMEPLLHNPQLQSDDLKAALLDSIKRANAQLFQKNQEIEAMRGTTLTGAIVLEHSLPAQDTSGATFTAHIINVGDSRTYLYSQTAGFSRITRDHSIVETLVECKMITPEERYTDRRRSEIYRCLGDKPEIDIDVSSLQLHPRDRLLVCSDGLWEMVRDPVLGSMLSLPIRDPAMIASLLLQAALEGGGEDNVTAIIALLPDE